VVEPIAKVLELEYDEYTYMGATMIMGMASLVSASVALLVLVGFAVVVLVVVRPRRPDVAPILLLALGLELLFMLGGFTAQVLLPRLLMPSIGMTHYAEAQAMSAMTMSLGHGVSRVLLIWAVARLAMPARS